MESEAECYLRRAAEARWLADISSPALKSDFLRIAENWELIARAVSERDRHDLAVCLQ
ncbi:MAG: hypothetical protein ABSD74_00170 [Rhizomicrobium sp.]|jgi:hypothetical protein